MLVRVAVTTIWDVYLAVSHQLTDAPSALRAKPAGNVLYGPAA